MRIAIRRLFDGGGNELMEAQKLIHSMMNLSVSTGAVLLLLVMIAAGCDTAVSSNGATESSMLPATMAKESASSLESNSAKETSLTVQPRARQQASEAQLASHRRMIEALKNVAAAASSDNVYLEDLSLRQATESLARLDGHATADAIWRQKMKVALNTYRVGDFEESVKLFEDALATIDSAQAGRNPANRAKLEFQLGEAYLRLAETQNCCQRYTPQSCLFPIQGQGIHQNKNSSRKAIENFEKTLRVAPLGSKVHLGVKWLLNIAYMTVGEYPDHVPKQYLIPPEKFRSSEPFPRFANISHKVGLDTVSLSGGAVGDDLNGDHDIDLLVSNWDPQGQIKMFINNSDRSFTDATERAGLTGILGGLNLIQADFDNDQDVDVLVLRGAWLDETGRQPNSLLMNLGDGRFVDVAYAAGIAGNDYPTQTAAWADYDNDGDLDLYVGNETTQKLAAPSQLFRNNGDGTFTDVAEAAGVPNNRFTKAVVWGDFDADNDPDLYVSNLREPNRLYKNNGDGTFVDVAVELGVHLPLASFPAWFWDFNNDGHLDLFVSAYAADISELAASYEGLDLDVEMARLYKNDGRGGFVDVAEQMQLTRPTAPMGSNFGDLDNDGFLDFYLGTGYPTYRSLMPNVMYRNRSGERFADVTFAGRFGNLQKGHAVVFADFDNDGDQDVFEQMGGALAGDTFVDALYENPGFSNNWIKLKLIGTQSNRSAIGANIHLVNSQPDREQHFYKVVNSGGSFGANPLGQHIGIGTADTVSELTITWPTTGEKQVFQHVKANQAYVVVEGEDQLRVIAAQSAQ